MSRDTDLHELVGAYALDALDADEAEDFERHLESCPRCRAELRDHRETAALLAHAGTAAPAGVWERIAEKLDGGGEPVPDLDRDVVIPIGRVRAGRAPVWRRAAVAAAVAAAAIIAVNSVVLVNQRDDIARLDPSSASSVQALADRALEQDGTRVATLRQPGGGAIADVVITRDGRGFLTRANLPGLDADHTYQLWGLRGDHTPVSLGVLGRRPDAVAFSAAVPIDKLAVTVEVAGGVAVSANPAFVVGEVRPVE